MTTFTCRGLAAGSLYKLLFIGLLTPLFIFSLCCGIASYYGHSTVSFNNHYVYGLKGLIVGTLLGIVLPIMLSALLWCLIGFGLWVWTRIKPIHLTLKD